MRRKKHKRTTACVCSSCGRRSHLEAGDLRRATRPRCSCGGPVNRVRDEYSRPSSNGQSALTVKAVGEVASSTLAGGPFKAGSPEGACDGNCGVDGHARLHGLSSLPIRGKRSAQGHEVMLETARRDLTEAGINPVSCQRNNDDGGASRPPHPRDGIAVTGEPSSCRC
jgi:hypothetical protein